MEENNKQTFNHLKIHSQYSICEGALKIDDLKEFSKLNKIKSLALCDTTNLCGALEFSENISKVGTQPIIGTQINFKYKSYVNLLPIIANTFSGYKSIINLSSKSYIQNNSNEIPYCKFEDLFDKTGSGKKKMPDDKQAEISASFASGVLNEAPETNDALQALIYQVRLLQDDMNEIRRYNELGKLLIF